MYDDLFTSSTKSRLKDLAMRDFENKGFSKSMEEQEPSIEFHSECVKTSTMNKELRFTNRIRRGTPEAITGKIKELFLDPEIVNREAKQIDRKEKIDNCVQLYYDLEKIDQGELYQSQLNAAFGQQDGVRVYSVAEMREDMKKAVLKIVLIDPFHLVIPSKHKVKKNGRTTTLSKEEMEKQTFDAEKGNGQCISSLIEN